MNVLSKQSGRQEVIAARLVLDYSAAGAVAAAEAVGHMEVPQGSQVVGGDIVVETAFDSTVNTLDFGDGDTADEYLAAVDLKSTGRTALTLTGKRYTTLTDLIAAITNTVTDATEGRAVITVLYVVDGRVAFGQGLDSGFGFQREA